MALPSSRERASASANVMDRSGITMKSRSPNRVAACRSAAPIVGSYPRSGTAGAIATRIPRSGAGAPRRVLQDVLEREVAVDLRLLREAEHALTDRVALDLARTPRDRGHGGEVHRQRGLATPGIAVRPRLRRRPGERHAQARGLARQDRARKLGDRALGAHRDPRRDLVAHLLAHQREHLLRDVQLRELLTDDGVTLEPTVACELDEPLRGRPRPARAAAAGARARTQRE